jgi:hypothetical protein
MLQELGHELVVGEAGKIRALETRKLAIRLYIMLREGIDYEEFCRRGPDGSGRGSHAGMLGDVALV